MNVLLIALYAILWLLNAYLSGKKEQKFLIFLSFGLLFFVMCFKTNVQPVDGFIMDLAYYERDYNLFTGINSTYEKMYYLFFSTQVIGHKLGLSFVAWWAVWCFFLLVLLFRGVKRFGYNTHRFLTYFFFFVIALYASLKQFSGFVFFFYGVSFLVRHGKKDRLRFILFTLIAGGFHPMFYMMLVLLLVDLKTLKPKYIFGAAAALMVCVATFAKPVFVSLVRQMANSFLQNGSGNAYFESTTNFGFLIPVALHLSNLLFSYWYYKSVQSLENPSVITKAKYLYFANLICTVFYPFFLFATVFTRLITIMSLLTLVFSGEGICRLSMTRRQQLMPFSLVTVFLFALYFFGPCRFFEFSVVQLFTVYI